MIPPTLLIVVNIKTNEETEFCLINNVIAGLNKLCSHQLYTTSFNLHPECQGNKWLTNVKPTHSQMVQQFHYSIAHLFAFSTISWECLLAAVVVTWCSEQQRYRMEGSC